MMLTTATVISLAWKSAVIAGLALLLLRLARRRSAAQRSFLAHAGLLAVVALPPAMLLLPAWSPLPATVYAPVEPASLTVPDAAHAMPPEPSELPPATSDPSPATAALLLYGVPALLLLAALLVAVVRLFAMRRRAVVLVDTPWLTALAGAQRRMGFKHCTALLVSDELRSPISWGVLRPTIVLDPAAVAASREAEAIIAHELAHVARLDWGKLLVARLACAVFWFNPLVWMLARESHQLREEAADDAVLLSDVEGTDYAALLVNAARHDNQPLLLAAHGVAPGRGSLKRRIARVLDGGLSRAPAGAGWGALCLLAVVGVGGPLAAFGPVAPAPLIAASPPLEDTGRLTGITAPAAPITPDDLIDMRAVGVIPADIAQQRRPSAGNPPRPREIVTVKATAAKGDPAARSPSRHGPVRLDDVVAAKAVGVDADYVARMEAIFPGVPLRELIGARALGVTPGYAAAVRARYPQATVRDVTRMRAVEGRVPGPRGPSAVEVRGPAGIIRAEARANGRAVARITDGDRTIEVVDDTPDPPDPPEVD